MDLFSTILYPRRSPPRREGGPRPLSPPRPERVEIHATYIYTLHTHSFNRDLRSELVPLYLDYRSQITDSYSGRIGRVLCSSPVTPFASPFVAATNGSGIMTT